MSTYITDIISSKAAVTPDSGRNVYDIVLKSIHNSKKIDISFAGIENLTSAFLNSFIGRLYSTVEVSEIEKYVSFSDLKEDSLWGRKFNKIKSIGSNSTLLNAQAKSLMAL